MYVKKIIIYITITLNIALFLFGLCYYYRRVESYQQESNRNQIIVSQQAERIEQLKWGYTKTIEHNTELLESNRTYAKRFKEITDRQQLFKRGFEKDIRELSRVIDRIENYTQKYGEIQAPVRNPKNSVIILKDNE